MGQSQSKSDQKPKPGDLIEIDRGLYEHWAVYVGDGWVVHVTLRTGAEVPGKVSNSLMSVPTEKAMVKKEKLQEVVGNNTWRINNSLDEKYEPRPADIIVVEALRQVDNVMEYSVISKNCEHFVKELRYRKAVSRQVRVARKSARFGLKRLVIFAIPVVLTCLTIYIITRRTFSSTSPPI